MNVQLLIDAIVRQVTVLIAQLATSGGVRAPLARVANQVFLGEPCNGEVGCTDAPAGIARLREVLLQVEFQQLGRGDCRPTSACYQPMDPGPCTGSFERFRYDPETGTCTSFNYGGCDGNDNRFETLEACSEACDFDACRQGSALANDGGPCAGTIVSQRGIERCFLEPRAACACACAIEGREAIGCNPNDSGMIGISCQ